MKNALKKYKLKAWFSLLLIIASILFSLTWLWGVIILLWLIPDLISGNTYLAEPISRKESPILYWAIVCVWLIIITYLLVDRFIPSLLPEAWQSGYYITY